jgi:hypothetical protein
MHRSPLMRRRDSCALASEESLAGEQREDEQDQEYRHEDAEQDLGDTRCGRRNP